MTRLTYKACRANWTLWDRFRLLFVRPYVYWDHDEKWVMKMKRLGDKVFVLRSEPIAYGDQRNYQIDSLYGWFTKTTEEDSNAT